MSLFKFIETPQDLVDLLEKKIDETEKKYKEASTLCEERLKQVIDTETKLIELKTSMQRLLICILSLSKVSILYLSLLYVCIQNNYDVCITYLPYL